MLRGLLGFLAQQEPRRLGPARAQRGSSPRLPDVGDVVFAYPPRADSPNKPGLVPVPCLVLGIGSDRERRPVLSVAVGATSDNGAPRASDVILTGRDSLDAAGINRAAKFMMSDRRTIPWKPGFIEFKSPVLGRLTDADFDRARRAYGLQRHIETERQESVRTAAARRAVHREELSR